MGRVIDDDLDPKHEDEDDLDPNQLGTPVSGSGIGVLDAMGCEVSNVPATVADPRPSIRKTCVLIQMVILFLMYR
jgi:hypothetical protein